MCQQIQLELPTWNFSNICSTVIKVLYEDTKADTSANKHIFWNFAYEHTKIPIIHKITA
jgi:hypothetical protein